MLYSVHINSFTSKAYSSQPLNFLFVLVLKTFLNWGHPKSKVIHEEMLQQLIKILEWWRHQRTFHIYSSSVLLTYDAEFLYNKEEFASSNQSKSQPISNSRVYLIDFAHVVPAKNTIDYNYLSGLECFVDIFSSLIKGSWHILMFLFDPLDSHKT